jgi:hypothetical protein
VSVSFAGQGSGTLQRVLKLISFVPRHFGLTERYRALAIVVVTTDRSVVSRIAVFPDPRLMPAFGLPIQL